MLQADVTDADRERAVRALLGWTTGDRLMVKNAPRLRRRTRFATRAVSASSSRDKAVDVQ
jgi:hypothetical protein